MHHLAEAYGKRPSEIIGLKTPWGAYQFDEVCLVAGRIAENNAMQGKPSLGSRIMQGYQSVKEKLGKRIKKVRIKPDGTW